MEKDIAFNRNQKRTGVAALISGKKSTFKECNKRNLPGGPVLQDLPSNAQDSCSIPGQGTKTQHAAQKINPHTATTEPPHSSSHD